MELDGLRGLAALGVVLAHYITLANTFVSGHEKLPIGGQGMTR